MSNGTIHRARTRRSLLEQMVSWQRRALNSLCGRVDLLQADIDRQAGAQTELEARLLDIEGIVFGAREFSRPCCTCHSAPVVSPVASAEGQPRAGLNG